MSTATVRVNLAERAYDIEIGSGLLDRVVEYHRKWGGRDHVVIVTDETVEELYADRLADRLSDEEIEVHLLVIPPGEHSKSADTAIELWETMLAEGIDRDSTVMAVGGGVVGDLAGFVAATFARGLPLIQVPTTLLAQVDSSVGGKVGINLSEAKNMVGAFWQPRGVLADVDVLGSLPEREFAAGLAEVIKYGVIMDAEFFAWLEANVAEINARVPAALMYIVERSCRLKADVVEADEHETSGRRAILNYGHTFGHALEAATGYGQLLHGEAVAIGMGQAARLAERLGYVDAAMVVRLQSLIQALQLPLAGPDVDPDELLRLMWHDKKVRDNRLVFVLPKSIGRAELEKDIREADVLAVLASG